jgi:hypothetical protein
MVFSLTWFHLARGRTTKQEVVEMLGEGDARGDGRACLTYSLGMCSGLGVDYDDLLVCFDDDNKFERTKRRQG